MSTDMNEVISEAKAAKEASESHIELPGRMQEFQKDLSSLKEKLGNRVQTLKDGLSKTEDGVPKEGLVQRRMEIMVEKVAISSVTGLLVGSAVALVLMRRPSTRGFAIGFGTGCGAGVSWTQSSGMFSKK